MLYHWQGHTPAILLWGQLPIPQFRNEPADEKKDRSMMARRGRLGLGPLERAQSDEDGAHVLG
jgi:hypothetical protein